MEEHNPGPGRKGKILVSACLAGESNRLLIPETQLLYARRNWEVCRHRGFPANASAAALSAAMAET